MVSDPRLLKAGAHELERVEAARRRAHLERLAKDVRDIAVWRLAGLGQAMSSSIEADYEARRGGTRALDAAPLTEPFAVLHKRGERKKQKATRRLPRAAGAMLRGRSKGSF